MPKRAIGIICITVLSLLIGTASLMGVPQQKQAKKTMYMNLQKLVIYHSKSTSEYYVAAHSIDPSTKPGVFDTMNVHVILEGRDGNKKTIDNEDLKIACLGHMYNKVIGEKTTLFRFNMIIDNSGSIDQQSLGYVQNALTKFVKLVPLVFEAQVIRFSSGIQLKTPFTKNKGELTNAINQPLGQGGTALFDAMDVGMQEIKALGDDVPLRFSVVLTDGMNNSSTRNPDPNTFKAKIISECRRNYIPLFIVGVTDGVDSQLLKAMTVFGHYQHIKDFPDIDKAFTVILNLLKETYIFKIPAVGNFANLKKIYLVKRTPGGNLETIQDFFVH